MEHEIWTVWCREINLDRNDKKQVGVKKDRRKLKLLKTAKLLKKGNLTGWDTC